MTRPHAIERADSGLVLLNVLVVVAVTSAVVMIMISSQDLGIQRGIRIREAAQAAAIARGGEASAIVALRRDGLENPESDHAGEAWARLAEVDAPIEGGTFTLAIVDAQGRFNVNMVGTGDRLAVDRLRQILAAVQARAGLADQIAGFLRSNGPIDDIGALRDAGVDAATLSKLEPLITALPGSTRINLNAASEPLLGIMFGNPVTARLLAARRSGAGFLTREDVVASATVLPPGAGFTSNYFEVTTIVTIGDTRQALTSRLARRRREGGVEVVAITRRRWADEGYAASSPRPIR